MSDDGSLSDSSSSDDWRALAGEIDNRPHETVDLDALASGAFDLPLTDGPRAVPTTNANPSPPSFHGANESGADGAAAVSSLPVKASLGLDSLLASLEAEIRDAGTLLSRKGAAEPCKTADRPARGEEEGAAFIAGDAGDPVDAGDPGTEDPGTEDPGAEDPGTELRPVSARYRSAEAVSIVSRLLSRDGVGTDAAGRNDASGAGGGAAGVVVDGIDETTGLGIPEDILSGPVRGKGWKGFGPALESARGARGAAAAEGVGEDASRAEETGGGGDGTETARSRHGDDLFAIPSAWERLAEDSSDAGEPEQPQPQPHPQQQQQQQQRRQQQQENDVHGGHSGRGDEERLERADAKGDSRGHAEAEATSDRGAWAERVADPVGSTTTTTTSKPDWGRERSSPDPSSVPRDAHGDDQRTPEESPEPVVGGEAGAGSSDPARATDPRPNAGAAGKTEAPDNHGEGATADGGSRPSTSRGEAARAYKETLARIAAEREAEKERRRIESERLEAERREREERMQREAEARARAAQELIDQLQRESEERVREIETVQEIMETPRVPLPGKGDRPAPDAGRQSEEASPVDDGQSRAGSATDLASAEADTADHGSAGTGSGSKAGSVDTAEEQNPPQDVADVDPDLEREERRRRREELLGSLRESLSEKKAKEKQAAEARAREAAERVAARDRLEKERRDRERREREALVRERAEHEAEAQRKKDEKRRLREEEQRIKEEEARRVAEATRVAEEKKRVEEERKRAEEEERRVEEERKRAEAEKKRVEEERKRVAEEKKRVEEEKRRAEEERQRAEEEARRAEREETRRAREERIEFAQRAALVAGPSPAVHHHARRLRAGSAAGAVPLGAPPSSKSGSRGAPMRMRPGASCDRKKNGALTAALASLRRCGGFGPGRGRGRGTDPRDGSGSGVGGDGRESRGSGGRGTTGSPDSAAVDDVDDSEPSGAAGGAPPAGSVALDDALLELQNPTTPLAQVAEVDLALENIGEMTDLWRCPNLRHLSLNSNAIVQMRGLERNPRLETLRLRDNRLVAIDGLENKSDLYELCLEQNAIRSIAGLARGSATNLRVLTLSSNKVSRLVGGASDPLSAVPNLRKLSLYRNRVRTTAGVAERLETLSYLDVGRNALPAASGLTRMRHLSTLILYENEITEFPDVSGCPLLRRLWLNGNRIGSVPDLSGAPRLEFLNLQENEIASIAPAAWAGCPVLSKLNLSFNALTDADSVADELIAASASLRELWINDNPFATEAPDLAAWALGILPALEELNNAAVVPGDASTCVQRALSWHSPRDPRHDGRAGYARGAAAGTIQLHTMPKPVSCERAGASLSFDLAAALLRSATRPSHAGWSLVGGRLARTARAAFAHAAPAPAPAPGDAGSSGTAAVAEGADTDTPLRPPLPSSASSLSASVVPAPASQPSTSPHHQSSTSALSPSTSGASGSASAATAGTGSSGAPIRGSHAHAADSAAAAPSLVLDLSHGDPSRAIHLPAAAIAPRAKGPSERTAASSRPWTVPHVPEWTFDIRPRAMATGTRGRGPSTGVPCPYPAAPSCAFSAVGGGIIPCAGEVAAVIDTAWLACGVRALFLAMTRAEARAERAVKDAAKGRAAGALERATVAQIEIEVAHLGSIDELAACAEALSTAPVTSGAPQLLPSTISASVARDEKLAALWRCSAVERNAGYFEKTLQGRQNAAALRIQKFMRPWLAGAPARRAAREAMSAANHGAATAIQRMWRGVRVRLRLSRIERLSDDSDLEELDDDFLYDERMLDLDADLGPALRIPDGNRSSAATAASASAPSSSSTSSSTASSSSSGSGGVTQSESMTRSRDDAALSGAIHAAMSGADALSTDAFLRSSLGRGERGTPLLSALPPRDASGAPGGAASSAQRPKVGDGGGDGEEGEEDERAGWRSQFAKSSGKRKGRGASRGKERARGNAPGPGDATVHSPGPSPHHGGSPQSQEKRRALAGEWGFNDDSSSTVELMMRRRQQLKRLRARKSKAAAMANPEKRLERFRRTAAERPPLAATARPTRAAGVYAERQGRTLAFSKPSAGSAFSASGTPGGAPSSAADDYHAPGDHASESGPGTPHYVGSRTSGAYPRQQLSYGHGGTTDHGAIPAASAGAGSWEVQSVTSDGSAASGLPNVAGHSPRMSARGPSRTSSAAGSSSHHSHNSASSPSPSLPAITGAAPSGARTGGGARSRAAAGDFPGLRGPSPPPEIRRLNRHPPMSRR